jgi:hypothetical protein
MEKFSIHYTGPSMYPTFLAGDVLQVIPTDKFDLEPGDIIVFRSPKDGRSKVVHRVVSNAIDDGIRTRGDNNLEIDTFPVTKKDIFGRVVAATRNGRQFRVQGGNRGLRYARIRWIIKKLETIGLHFLRPVYHRLCRSRLLKAAASNLLKTRVVAFNRSDGTELQLIAGQQIVGRKPPGSSKWWIRRPYRLFIDESTLPG